MYRSTLSSLFKCVSVWGGGTMGGGIAQVAAHSGYHVNVVERTPALLDKCRKGIEFSLSRIGKKKCEGDEAKVKLFVDEVVSRITFTTDETLAATKANLIIEAIVEDINAKKALWKQLDGIAPKETIFCTNTSSLRVADMASVTSRADRFAGVHFFSPVPMMKLVEIVKTDKTSPLVLQQLSTFCEKMGKIKVIAKDTDGFIVNRLLVPYQMEACRLVERGVASVEDVDKAMKYGCGYPMGPFELADSVGIDVLKMIIQGWHEKEPSNPLFKPSELINQKVKEGKLGRKTFEGFYKYDKK